jgi:hypothetical protein
MGSGSERARRRQRGLVWERLAGWGVSAEGQARERVMGRRKRRGNPEGREMRTGQRVAAKERGMETRSWAREGAVVESYP